MYNFVRKALLYGLIASTALIPGCRKIEDVKVERPYQEKKIENVQSNQQSNPLEEKLCDYHKNQSKVDNKVSYQENKLEKLIANESDKTLKTFYEVLKEMKDEEKENLSKYSLPLKISDNKELNEYIKSVNEDYANKVKTDKTIDLILDSETKEDDRRLGQYISDKNIYMTSLLCSLGNYERAVKLYSADKLIQEGINMPSYFDKKADERDGFIKDFSEGLFKSDSSEEEKIDADEDWIEELREVNRKNGR
ncbi:hypothetical protein KY334_03900 [Candidatus Woesearchaeota archaeon]|nr:hypothetical protein [Candidatus Woesearchaeota archaeon]